ncbi:MAG: hypothetical protein J7484_04470 [Microbacterium sp.]|nr:hypothetical protein [Microbacterium sp.]
MRSPIPAAAVLLAATLALAGCSLGGGAEKPSGDSTGTVQEATAPKIDAPAATGQTISGDGYSYVVPEGWGVPEQSVPGFDPDSLAADLQDADGFTDNVNVVKSPVGVVDADRVESAGVKELDAAGASEVTVNDRVTIAGSESAHLTALMTAGGATYAIEQYYVSTADQTYIVTFSFNDTVASAERTALAESVLVTWRWA